MRERRRSNSLVVGDLIWASFQKMVLVKTSRPDVSIDINGRRWSTAMQNCIYQADALDVMGWICLR